MKAEKMKCIRSTNNLFLAAGSIGLLASLIGSGLIVAAVSF
jgi:hypothetical protein